MHTVTRPDGTTYLSSTRPTYFSIGSFAAGVRQEAVAHLRLFGTALDSGLPLHAVIEGLPGSARQAGAVAAALVQAFAAVSGASARLVVEEHVRVLEREECVGVFADRSFPEPFADLADRVAHALGDLLSALGAQDIVAGNVD